MKDFVYLPLNIQNIKLQKFKKRKNNKNLPNHKLNLNKRRKY